MGPLSNVKKRKKQGNPGVGVDFKKVKHKVGKKLPKAQNETDTSFKARSINLPSQAVKQDKDGLATNFQNLTLKELLAQSSHYNEKMRKHALQGLGDLFIRHPQELTGHLGLVVGRLVERMLDSEEDVRSQLQQLWRERIQPLVQPGLLRPFMPSIMAHVSGATTHLSMDIRNDALVFLDILMDHVPGLVSSGFLLPCLAHFCDLLSSGHRSRSIRGQSLKALLKILKSLVDFLTRAFPNTTSSSTRGDAPARAPRRRFTALRQSKCDWPGRSSAVQAFNTSSTSTDTAAAAAHEYEQALKQERGVGTPGAKKAAAPGAANASKTPGNAQASTPSGQAVSTQLHTPEEAARKLLHLLVDCWPECQASELSVKPEQDNATALVYILTASGLLIENVLGGFNTKALSEQGDAATRQEQLLITFRQRDNKAIAERLQACILPSFPAVLPAVRPTQAVLDLMVQYNVKCAQLLVRLLPTRDGNDQHQRIPVDADVDVTQHGQQDWSQALVSFYESVLKSGQAVPASGLNTEVQVPTKPTDQHAEQQRQQSKQGKEASSAAANSRRGVDNTVYYTVLQAVESAVYQLDVSQARRLLSAVDTLSSTLPSKAALKAAILAMQYRLMQDTQSGKLQLEASCIHTWLSALPKMLWELGSTASETSRTGLRMLHDTARFTHASSDSHALQPQPHHGQGQDASGSDVLNKLQVQLAPLWGLQVNKPAAKGVASGDKKKAGNAGSTTVVLPGPVSKLPVDCQLIAADTLYHFGSLHPALLSSVLRCVQHQLVSPATCTRVTELLMTQAATCMKAAQATSLVLTLLFSPTSPAAATPTASSCSMKAETKALSGNVSGEDTKQQAKSTQDAANDSDNDAGDDEQSRDRKQAQALEWETRDLVLKRVQQVLPASVLLSVLSTHTQQVVKQVNSAVAVTQHAHTDTLALRLHAYCVLQLCRMALEEIAHNRSQVTALPDGLKQALPQLVCSYAVLCSRVAHDGAAHVGSVWSTGQSQGCNVWSHDAVQVTVNLCTAEPHLAVTLLRGVATMVKALLGTSRGGAAAAPAEFCALFMLTKAVLTHQPLRRVLLECGQGVRDATAIMTRVTDLPSSITSDMACSAVLQQVRYAVQDLLD